MGILNVLQGKFDCLEPLLSKIGATPDSKMFKSILKTLRKYKYLLRGNLDSLEDAVSETKAKAKEFLMDGLGKLASIGSMNVASIFE